MHYQNTVFRELLNHIPRGRFKKIVAAYDGDKHVRTFDSWTHLVSLIYAQLQGNTSLRDIETTLASHNNLTYHLGLKNVRRSTLSDANSRRNPDIFAEVFSVLLGKLEKQRPKQGEQMRDIVRLIDATPVPLSLFCQNWARVSHKYVAAKAHFVYDPDENIPVFFSVTKGNVNDITAAQTMPIEAGATYVFDKGYYSFAWWAMLEQKGCRFVTRLRKGHLSEPLEEREPIGKNIIFDRIIRTAKRISNGRSKQPNPMRDTPLRVIGVRRKNGEILELFTNDLEAPALEIAELYKRRWAIELFFKWVKQNLKIKKFLGMSENAIKIQVITAMIAFLLIQLVNKDLPKRYNMTRLTRLITANLMQKKSLLDMIKPPPDKIKLQEEKYQLVMNFKAS